MSSFGCMFAYKTWSKGKSKIRNVIFLKNSEVSLVENRHFMVDISRIVFRYCYPAHGDKQ